MPVFSIPAFGPSWIVAILAVAGISLTIEVIRNKNQEIDNIEDVIEDRVILRIVMPKNSEKKAPEFIALLQTLHGIVANRQRSYSHLSLEISSTISGIEFYIVCPQRYKTFVEGQIYTHFPYAEVMETQDYVTGVSSMDALGVSTAIAELELAKEYIFPLKTYEKFGVDPLVSLLGAFPIKDHFEMMGIQFLIRPVDDSWQQEGREYVKKIQKGKNPDGHSGLKNMRKILAKVYNGIFSIRQLQVKQLINLNKESQNELDDIESKNSIAGYEGMIRIIASAKTHEKALDYLNTCIAAFSQYTHTGLNAFRMYVSNDKEVIQLSDQITKYKTRYLDIEVTDIFSLDEVATIFHFPHQAIQTEHIVWSFAKKIEPAAAIPTENCLYIGETNFRNQHKQFGILPEDRRKHMYILGKTGSGKSTLVKQMIIQDIINGKGVGVIDPHGDLVDDILAYIPEDRVNDVIFIDPADIEYPIGVNMFASHHMQSKEYITSTIIDVFKKHFDSWGPRLEYILHNTIMTLLNTEGATFLSIMRILTDPGYRRAIIATLDDPILVSFWNNEYSQIERNSRLLAEAISPIQNKVGRFLATPLIRNMVSQPESKIDFEDIINNKKILLCNLSQGKIGEENTSLLGSLLITNIQSAIMARAYIAEEKREDFYLYVDEFQLFANATFTKIFSEARKYRLNLIVAHQYLGQLDDDIRAAVLGNIGTIITFLLSPDDAKVMEKEFFPVCTANDFISLDKYQIYIKETINSSVAQPFSADTTEVTYDRYDFIDDIKKRMHVAYGMKREDVEEYIRMWSMHSDNASWGNTRTQEKKEIKPSEPLRFY